MKPLEGKAIVRHHINNLRQSTKLGQKTMDMFETQQAEHQWEGDNVNKRCSRCNLEHRSWDGVTECKIGIAFVGTSKCTAKEAMAIRGKMSEILAGYNPEKDFVISGGAAGVDTIAESIANELGFEFVPYDAKTNLWEGVGGFKERNQKIADFCSVVYSFTTTTKSLLCYHCKKHSNNYNHEKTAGCWTFWQAAPHKRKEVVIVAADKNVNEFFTIRPKR